MSLTSRELIDSGVEVALLDDHTVMDLERKARREGADPLNAVTHHYRIPVVTLYRAAAEARGLTFVDPAQVQPDLELLRRVPAALLRRGQLLPIARESGGVLVATASPEDHATQSALTRILGEELILAMSDPESLAYAIERVLRELGGTPAVASAVADPVGLLDQFMSEAFLRRASDIHLEPQPDGLRVRLRVDGRLQEHGVRLSHEQGQALISRVKVLSGLDIAEQRAPQDGGFTYRGHEQKDVDVRVATLPTRWGERATLRLLGSANEIMSLSELGMSAADVDRFSQVIRSPHGMILLTGPTGSGKSTTLYAALAEISDPTRNVMTVEDPIEHPIAGVAQVQVGGGKVSFASALRSLLRHDPDVMMVGEIRDRETADIALRAAMTGHLLFSTLHTNDAVAAVARLRDVGCEPYLIASTLLLTIAQRLVMRLCDRCKIPRIATDVERALLFVPPGGAALTLYEPKGCAACLGRGYRGRVGLFEWFWMEDDLASLVANGADEPTLRAAAAGRLRTLATDGRRKLLDGWTSLSEVTRVTRLEPTAGWKD